MPADYPPSQQNGTLSPHPLWLHLFSPPESLPVPLLSGTPARISYIEAQQRRVVQTTREIAQWLNINASDDGSGIFDTLPATVSFPALAQIVKTNRNIAVTSTIEDKFRHVISGRQEIIAYLEGRKVQRWEERRRGEIFEGKRAGLREIEEAFRILFEEDRQPQPPREPPGLGGGYYYMKEGRGDEMFGVPDGR